MELTESFIKSIISGIITMYVRKKAKTQHVDVNIHNFSITDRGDGGIRIDLHVTSDILKKDLEKIIFEEVMK